MFGGVPQPQISRDGPKRPETAVFGVFLMPPAAGRRRENKRRRHILVASVGVGRLALLATYRKPGGAG